uniref:Uncharacterized protein n=1 Tax=Arundo donax TaxID=35708 RepID=A0A0A9CR73_ARUDO
MPRCWEKRTLAYKFVGHVLQFALSLFEKPRISLNKGINMPS